VVESDLAVELWSAIHDDQPHLISMSAGTTTRKGYPPIALSVVCEELVEAGILLVAAAGNDSGVEHFYPAYFSRDYADLGQTANPNVVSVGALDSVRRLAWFSNYDWPTVYARGSEIVNAYPEGSYTYREPPLVGAPDQDFSDRLAIWDGTSFATPLVSGLIAARMTTHSESVTAAWAALFAKASGQRGLGSGPSLFPGDAA
jgi:subtilisin family serine protease